MLVWWGEFAYVNIRYNCLRWWRWSLKTPPFVYMLSLSEPHTQSYIRSIRSYIFQIDLIYWFIVFNPTFSNISAISWRPDLVVEETGVPGENHRPCQATGILYQLRLRVKCILFVIYKAGRVHFQNRIGGVMVRVASVVYRGFEPRSGQTKDYLLLR